MPFPEIRPISDPRTHLGEIEETARRTRQPIIMTKNGTASLVVMASNACVGHMKHECAVAKLREAEIEAKYRTETVSHGEMKARIAAILEAARDHRGEERGVDLRRRPS